MKKLMILVLILVATNVFAYDFKFANWGDDIKDVIKRHPSNLPVKLDNNEGKTEYFFSGFITKTLYCRNEYITNDEGKVIGGTMRFSSTDEEEVNMVTAQISNQMMYNYGWPSKTKKWVSIWDTKDVYIILERVNLLSFRATIISKKYKQGL